MSYYNFAVAFNEFVKSDNDDLLSSSERDLVDIDVIQYKDISYGESTSGAAEVLVPTKLSEQLATKYAEIFSNYYDTPVPKYAESFETSAENYNVVYKPKLDSISSTIETVSGEKPLVIVRTKYDEQGGESIL